MTSMFKTPSHERGVLHGCAQELRRLAAVEAERDRYAAESAQHFIRAREWAERAGAMEAERDQLRAEVEALRRGEFICGKCGLRKDADATGPVPF